MIAWVDSDGNGQLERKEVGKAYASFKQYFIKGAETLKTMGPMLAMFGGGMGGGGMDGLGGLGAMGGMPGGGMPGGMGRGRGRGTQRRS